jgi:hypothetical protein
MPCNIFAICRLSMARMPGKLAIASRPAQAGAADLSEKWICLDLAMLSPAGTSAPSPGGGREWCFRLARLVYDLATKRAA